MWLYVFICCMGLNTLYYANGCVDLFNTGDAGKVFPAVASAKMCWDTTWYNNSHPSNITNPGDIEKPPSAEVLTNLTRNLCKKGTTLVTRCKDEKGEPFEGNKTIAGLFTTTCDATRGIVCTPNKSELCSDLAINFGCECLSSAPATHPGKVTVATGGSGSGNTTSGRHQSGHVSERNGMTSVTCNSAMLWTCFILFVLCL